MGNICVCNASNTFLFYATTRPPLPTTRPTTRPRLQRGWPTYAFATHQTLSFFHAPFCENKITEYHIKQYDFPPLVLVCNEDGQYMRLQRIKHFPFFTRHLAKTKLLSTTSNSMISNY
jgi:hypothetical protein